MNVLHICQEAVNTGFISRELAARLNQMVWCSRLSSVEVATIDFISRCIQVGKIKVAPESVRHLSRELHGVN